MFAKRTHSKATENADEYIGPTSKAKKDSSDRGGISGMGAAYTMSKSDHVVLFEAEARLGGHARTVLAGRSGHQPVDMGFIVFNYPIILL